ncbi:MAG: FG-GAP repeat protein [Planctomycetes bacterium]|nr:FG-GAP repeat protein [Planctomycetota bacterium]
MKPTTFLAALAALASPAAAQQQLYTLGQEAVYLADFGRSVADAGDVNGDGVGDVVVGAPFDKVNGVTKGRVYVYSGLDGALLWSRDGDDAGDLFGWCVDGVGDLDGDGKSEVIVGAPGWDNAGAWSSYSGRVYVVGGTGTYTPLILGINEQNAQLGYCVRGLGDIDGDGVAEFAVGTPYRDVGSLADAGYLSVWSGATFNLLFSRTGEHAGDKCGFSVDTVRNGGSQAWSRLIVGEPGVDFTGVDRGQARLMDGFGNTMSLFAGPTDNCWYGASVAGLGDATGDGWEDYAIAAPYADLLGIGAQAGLVRIYSGATTSIVKTLTGATATASFGGALAGVGDFDGDGLPDLAIGAPNDDAYGNDAGRAYVYTGDGSQLIATYAGTVNDHMGRSVHGLGDLNQDGFGELVVGANDAPAGQGRAYVYLGGAPRPFSYCLGKLNSAGCVPTATWSGDTSLALGGDLHLGAQDVVGGQPGMLIWSRLDSGVPFQGGFLCLHAPIVRTPVQSSGGTPGAVDCTGHFDFLFDAAYCASAGVAAGERLYAQYWYRDPGDAFGIGLTDAIAFDVRP